MQSNRRVDAALVAVALIWGATFVLVKQALDDISTLLFLTIRFGVATAALALLFGKSARADLRHRHILWPSLGGGAIAGFCLFSGYVLQTFGLKYTTAAKAGFITGLYIPLVPLFGAIAYRRKPQWIEVLGVGSAFIGMALMTVQGDILSIGLGDLLVMCCAVAYAFHILLLGHFAVRASTPVLTIAQIATAALLGAGTFWWAEPPRVRWTADVWVAIGVTALLATALAFSIQTWAQQYSSPTRTALIFATEPVFAWATSYLLLREGLSGRGITGALLILAGILMVELKPLRFGPHPST
jgi:drug/metabolite transporter (DMT)-like permease